MSSIDERIVQMEFDNKAFEKDVSVTLNTLGKLKEELKFDKVADGFDEITKAAKNVDLSGIEESLDKLTSRFSVFGEFIHNKLYSILDGVSNKFTSFVHNLTFDQVGKGFEKFGEKTSAVATLVNQGYDLAVVNEQLEKLNWYSDETSYSFTDMVSNIAKFTATGQGLEESVEAMMGIANWSASAGQNAQKASMAMYQLSQAMGKGALKYDDYKSIQNASMDTQEFRKEVVKAAVELGKLKEAGEGVWTTLQGHEVTLTNFTDYLSKDMWLDKDVMMKVFKTYSGAVDQIYAYSSENDLTASEAIKELGGEIDEFKLRVFKAAQEARTWEDVVSSLQDAVSSQWMHTFELIFGNYEEAKSLWTDLANELYDIFTAPNYAINEVLETWNEIGGRETLLNSFWNVFEGLTGAVERLKHALDGLLPSLDGEKLYSITAGMEAMTQKFRDSFAVTDELAKRWEKQAEAEEYLGKISVNNLSKNVEHSQKMIQFAIKGTLGEGDKLEAYLSDLGVSMDDYNAALDAANEALGKNASAAERAQFVYKYLSDQQIEMTDKMEKLLAVVSDGANNKFPRLFAILDGIKSVFHILKNTVVAVVRGFLPLIVTVMEIGGTLADIFLTLGDMVGSFFVELDSATEEMNAFGKVSAAVHKILLLIQIPLEIILALLKHVAEAFRNFNDSTDKSEGVQKLLGVLRDLWHMLKGVASFILSTIVNVFSRFLGSFSETGDAAEGFSIIIDKLAGALATFIGWIKTGMTYLAGFGKVVGGTLVKHFDEFRNAILNRKEGESFVKAFGKQALVEFKNLGTVMKSVAASVGEFFGSLKTRSANGNPFGFVDTIKSKALSLISIVGEMLGIGEDTVTGFALGVKNGIKSAVSTMISLGKAVISAIANTLRTHSPSRVMIDLGGNTIDGLIVGMKERLKALVETVTNIGSTVKRGFEAFFKGFDIDQLSNFARSGALFEIGRGFKALAAPMEGASSVMEAYAKRMAKGKDPLSILAKSYKSFADGEKRRKTGEAILDIAKAIAILSVVFIGMSIAIKKLEIKPEEMVASGIIMAAMLVALTGSLALISKILDNIPTIKMATISITLIAMAAAMTALSVALAKVAKIGDPKKMFAAAGSLAIIMATLAASVTLMMISLKKANITKIAGVSAAMLAMGKAVKTLTDSVSVLGNLKPAVWEQGLKAVLGLLAGIGVAMAASSGTSFGSAASFITLALALNMLIPSLQILGNMDPDVLKQGGIALALLASGVAVLNIAMSAFGGIGGSVAMAAMAASLYLLIPPILILGTLAQTTGGMSVIALGITSIVTALGSIAVVGAFANLAVPGLTAMAAVLTAFSVSALSISAGLGVLAIAVGLLIDALIKIGNNSEAIITGLESIGLGIAAFINGLIDGLASISNKLEEGTLILVQAIINIVVESLLQLTDAILFVIGGILNLLAEYAPQFGETAVLIIANFINGIAAGADELILAVVDLVIAVINGVTDALDARGDDLLGAFERLGLKILDILLQLGKDILDWFLNLPIVQKVIEKTTELKNTVMSWIDDFKTGFKNSLDEFKDFGAHIINGLKEGIKNGWESLKTTISNLGGMVLNTFKDMLGIHSPSLEFEDAGVNIVAGAQQGVKKQSGGFLQDIYNTGKQAINNFKKGADSEKAISNAGDKLKSWLGLDNIFGGHGSTFDASTVLGEEADATGNAADGYNKLGDAAANSASTRAAAAKTATQQVVTYTKEELDALRPDKYKNVEFIQKTIAGMLQDIENGNMTDEKAAKDAESIFEGYCKTLYEKSIESSKAVSKSADDKKSASAKEYEMLQKMRDAYIKAYDDIEKTVKKGANIFAESTKKSGVSASKMMKNMKEQQSMIREWSHGIAVLTERGLDKEVIKKLVEEGPEATYNSVQDLLLMTMDEMAEFNKGYDNLVKQTNDSTIELTAAMALLESDVERHAEWTVDEMDRKFRDVLKKIKMTTEELKEYGKAHKEMLDGLYNISEAYEAGTAVSMKNVKKNLKSWMSAINRYEHNLDIAAAVFGPELFKDIESRGIEFNEQLEEILYSSETSASDYQRWWYNFHKNNGDSYEKSQKRLADTADNTYKDINSKMQALGVTAEIEARNAESRADKMKELMDGIKENVKSGVQSMIHSFEDIDIAETKSFDDIFGAMQKRTDALQEYASGMKYISKRGVGYAILQDLAKMSPSEALPYIRSFMGMTYEEIMDVNQQWIAQTKLGNSIVKSITNTIEKTAGGAAKGTGYYFNSVKQQAEDAEIIFKRTAETVKKEFTDMQTSLKDTITSGISLFDRFDTKTDISAKKMLRNMRSQVEGILNWEANLTELGERGIEQGLLKKLADMGPSGFKYTQTFVNMTAEQLEEANKLFRDAETLPESVSNNVAASYTLLGDNVGQAFKDGLIGQFSVEDFEGIGNNALQALQYAFGIFEGSSLVADSPSYQLGEYLAEYMAQGNDAATEETLKPTLEENAEETIQETIATVVDAIENKATPTLSESSNKMVTDIIETIRLAFWNARKKLRYYGEFVAKNICIGLENGIAEHITPVVNRVRSMMLVVTAAAEAAVQVKSPSRVFYRIGQYIDEGLANGISENGGLPADRITAISTDMTNTMHEAMKRFTELANDELSTDPVIKPVLDLTDIQNGNAYMQELFGHGPAIRAAISGVEPNRRDNILQSMMEQNTKEYEKLWSAIHDNQNQPINMYIYAAEGQSEEAIADAVLNRLNSRFEGRRLARA